VLPLPLWAEFDEGAVAEAWAALLNDGLGNAEMSRAGDAPFGCCASWDESEQSRNVS